MVAQRIIFKLLYSIGTGFENNSLKVVTARQTQDDSMPGVHFVFLSMSVIHINIDN
jgi:hypothetical protein